MSDHPKVGIIHPPPELRAIVDSTAKYVAKNGKVFEEKIKKEHKNKPKFSFLLNEDPYNAYYQHKVNEIRNQLLETLDTKPQEDQHKQQQQQQQQQQHNIPPPLNESSNNDQDLTSAAQNEPSDIQGGQPSPPCPSPPPPESRHETDQEAGDQSPNRGPRVRSKLNEYMQEMTMKLEKPEPLNYLASPASYLTNMDCDIIKLTAQFIATYGRSFLLELVSREQNNNQFDFLKPQHGQFSYVSHLIMQYALIQHQPLDIAEQLEKDASSQKHILDKIKMRAEWNRMLELEERKQEEAKEKEKALYSQIDWHDFVIVETIDYQPGEEGAFSPTTADQVGTRLLLQQRNEEQVVPVEMDIDMDMDSGQSDNDEQPDSADVALADAPLNLLPPKPDEVVIRRDYDPKAATLNKVAQQDNYFVSQLTNERVPMDKIHEHVRYNLADPKYLEKKEKMLQERINEETVFASGSQIQNSLKSLAERRTDIFGLNDNETSIGRRIDEEEDPKKKDDRLIWDGHKSSLKKKRTG